MPAIDTDNAMITVIAIFSIDPSQQQALIETIEEFVNTMKKQPGFISASLHKSLDGQKVANYVQWRSQADCDAFLSNSEVKAGAQKIARFGPHDSHLYEVVIWESKVGTPKIVRGGYLAHLAEFRMPPENQPRMVELAKEHIGKAMELPELISANFHRSLDGTSVINYGQWQDRNAIERLRKQPGFGSDSPYWEGIAENEFHLYEVVFTEPAE